MNSHIRFAAIGTLMAVLGLSGCVWAPRGHDGYADRGRDRGAQPDRRDGDRDRSCEQRDHDGDPRDNCRR